MKIKDIIKRHTLDIIGFDYRDALNIELFCLMKQSKNQINRIIISYKVVVKKVKYQHDLDGQTDFLVTIIEFMRFLNHA